MCTWHRGKRAQKLQWKRDFFFKFKLLNLILNETSSECNEFKRILCCYWWLDLSRFSLSFFLFFISQKTELFIFVWYVNIYWGFWHLEHVWREISSFFPRINISNIHFIWCFDECMRTIIEIFIEVIQTKFNMSNSQTSLQLNWKFNVSICTNLVLQHSKERERSKDLLTISNLQNHFA